ncbi:MAG TPA: FecR domain-containing protein [Ferruginibacter sp.]|nr:FecR domain-containing protein [Ferruginibacter sp.]HMP19945.1 FecR domain-containing protein [Ferruginibacter sp.]
MDVNKRIAYLFESYIKNTGTPEEKNELLELLGSGIYDEKVKALMDNAWATLPNQYPISEEQSQRILSAILSENRGKLVKMNPTNRHKRIAWMAAASVLVIVTGALSLLLFKNTADKTTITQNLIKPAPAVKNDAPPGVTGAVLTLADGTQIVLDSATDGKLARQGNTSIEKKGGQITYTNNTNTADESIQYNTITTPRGRQFQLVLEDGTRVWLNAGSSVSFPAVFKGQNREVAITGEAYFEVAKDASRPFRVEAKGMVVEVLGTYFNVNAYDDEATVNTTLLEGSVRVKKDGREKMLTPGQQAQMNNRGDFTLARNVNTEEVMAWKNNYFSFNNTDIHKLLRQLERWYDVNVEIKGSVQPVTFNGSISRNVNLSNVLKMLEYTGEVKFTVEGRKLIVTM